MNDSLSAFSLSKMPQFSELYNCVDFIGCFTNVLTLFFSARNTDCWGIGAICLLVLTGEESVIIPSQIIRVDLLEKVHELRDMMGEGDFRPEKPFSRRADKVGRLPLTTAKSILLKIKNEKQMKEYKNLLPTSFLAQQQLAAPLTKSRCVSLGRGTA